MSKVRRPSRYGLAFASTRSSTRMILSTVSTSGVDFPFSRRLSVSGRIPARRAKSVCVKPADFLRRIILRARQSAKAGIAFSEPRCPRTSPRRGKPDSAEIQVPRRRSSNSRSRAACSSLRPPSSSSGDNPRRRSPGCRPRPESNPRSHRLPGFRPVVLDVGDYIIHSSSVE